MIGKPCVDVMDRAFVEVCPVEAFFTEIPPGRDEPLGSPGGAAKIGPLGVDTPLLSARPRADGAEGA